MIVNLVDSMINMPPSGKDVVNVCWHAGSPLPFFLPPEVCSGTVSLMRIIAPHRDLGLLTTLLGRALPSLRRYFVPNGWIEIYGSKASKTIGDSLNVICGALHGDRLQTIGGALRGDRLQTIGGALHGDRLQTIGGALRGDNLQTIGGALRGDAPYVVGRRLSAEQSWIMMGAQCLYVQP